MLAAFGWPVSELYHYTLSQQIGLDDLLAEGGKAPSVLNGGLDNAYVILGNVACFRRYYSGNVL